MNKKIIDKKRRTNFRKSKSGAETFKLRKKTRLSYRTRVLISYVLLFSFVLIAGLVLSLTVFFRIDDIEVTGTSMYSCDEIIRESAIKKGKNLFLNSVNKGEKRIQKELPYIEKIKISRKLPNKVVIEVEDSKFYYSIEHDGKYVIINRDGKIIDICDENKVCLFVRGVQLEDVSIGENAVFKDKCLEKNFNELLGELKKWNLSNIEKIDFSDSANIMIYYRGTIKINLGLYENISYKIRTAQEIINGKLKDGERGILDLSSVSSDNRSYFLQE